MIAETKASRNGRRLDRIRFKYLEPEAVIPSCKTDGTTSERLLDDAWSVCHNMASIELARREGLHASYLEYGSSAPMRSGADFYDIVKAILGITRTEDVEIAIPDRIIGEAGPRCSVSKISCGGVSKLRPTFGGN